MRIPNPFSIPWKTLSWTWVFVLFFIFCAQIHFLVKRDINTDLMTMAPNVAIDDARTQAQNILSTNLDNRVLFLVGFSQSYRSDFDSIFEQVQSQWRPPANYQKLLWETLEINSHLDFYRSISPRLMNVEDQRIISLSNNQQLLGRAVATFDSVGHLSLIPKSEDPFGFFSDWLTKRLPKNTFLPTGHSPKLFANNKVWGVLLYQNHNPNNIRSARRLLEATQELQTLVKQFDPNAEVLVHGLAYRNALFVESALREIIAITIFTVLGIGMVAWLMFKRKAATFGILFTAASSYIAACSATTIVFGSLHLWTALVGTLIFGMSAAMAGAYYCLCQNEKYNTLKSIQNFLATRLGIAAFIGMVTAALLFWAPHYTVKQLTIFSIAGLMSAYLTSVLILPYLYNKSIPESDFVRHLSNLYQKLPILSADRWMYNLANSVTLSLVILFVIIGGFWQVHFSHDVRNLVNFNLQQREVETQVEKLLALPSTNRYFIVNGATQELTLMNEEALQHALDRRDIPGVDLHCITKWFPSQTRQATVEKAKQEAFARIEEPFENYLGFDVPNPRYQTTETVTFDDWYASPASRPVRHLWMTLPEGFASIVQIAGISDNNIEDLTHLSQTMSGLSFVNTDADSNQLLTEYRTLYIGLFFLMAVVYCTLTLFYFGLSTWRVVFPPVLGVALAVAVMSWLGLPFKLFTILSIVLAFGMGFNFSLLVANASKTDALKFTITTFASWMGIVSSVLLMACQSPAVQTLGLTIALSLFFTWFLTPLMRRA
ncbi:MAG: hypothetical protein J6V64_01005 [Burkholderiaceae bacterium]|nr:hypothetical protein [Burkholderiaceae bacterium]